MPESIIWTHEENGTITLHGGSSISVLKKRKGLDNPPFTLVREKAPGWHGTRLTEVSIGERIVTLPILVQGTSESNYLATRRALNKYFNPVDGRGILKWTSLDGTTRWLYCYYLSGLEGDDENANTTWSIHDIQLVAVDPFWYRNVESSFVLGGSTNTAFLGTPFLPLNIGESSIADAHIVNNTGDIEIWPEILIEGPISALVIDNDTTGKKIDLTGSTGLSLTAGQFAKIITKPGARVVYDPDTPTTNYFSFLTADSTFFSFIPGNNTISISASSTTSATQITFTYRVAYTIK